MRISAFDYFMALNLIISCFVLYVQYIVVSLSHPASFLLDDLFPFPSFASLPLFRLTSVIIYREKGQHGILVISSHLILAYPN